MWPEQLNLQQRTSRVLDHVRREFDQDIVNRDMHSKWK